MTDDLLKTSTGTLTARVAGGALFSDGSGNSIEIIREAAGPRVLVRAKVLAAKPRFRQLEKEEFDQVADSEGAGLRIPAHLLTVGLRNPDTPADLSRLSMTGWRDATDLKSPHQRVVALSGIVHGSGRRIDSITCDLDSPIPELMYAMTRILPLKSLYSPRGAIRRVDEHIGPRSTVPGYGVYVIRLRRGRRGIAYYVGQSAHTPEDRYRQHRLGTNSAHGVQGNAVGLAWKFFEHLDRYEIQAAAIQAERRLFERMARNGRNVFGGT